MKNVFLFFFFPFFIIGCKSVNVVHKTSMDEAGSYYYLPKTILQIELESIVTQTQAGKFKTYSEEMIGLKPYSDSVSYQPAKIKISSIAVPDDQALFLVKGKCISVNKNASGIIQSVNAPAYQETKDNTETKKIKTKKEEDEEQLLVFYKRPPVVHEKHTRKVKRDTSAHDSTAVPEELKEPVKTSSNPVYDSAVAYQSRLQQLESLLSDYTDCENCENAGVTKISLKLIKQQRKQYIELFTGTTDRQKTTQQLLLDDKILAGLKTEREIRISKEEVLKKNNIQVVIQALNSVSITSPKEEKAGLAYRIPVTVLISVIDTRSKAVLFSDTREIALPGTENVNSLPVKTRKVVFDEKTGAVLKSE